MKELFLSLQTRNGVGFSTSPALRAPPQEGDAYRTHILRRFARPPFKGGRGDSKTRFALTIYSMTNSSQKIQAF